MVTEQGLGVSPAWERRKHGLGRPALRSPGWGADWERARDAPMPAGRC